MKKLFLLSLIVIAVLGGCINQGPSGDDKFHFSYSETLQATFKADSATISIQQSPIEYQNPAVVYQDTSLATGKVILDLTIDAMIPTQSPDPYVNKSFTADSLALYYSFYPMEKSRAEVKQKTGHPTISTPPVPPTVLSIAKITVKRNPQFPVQVSYIVNR